MRKFMISTLGAILALAGITGTAGAANFTDTSTGISINIDNALKKQPMLRDIQSFISEDNSGSLVIRRIHDLAITDFMSDISRSGYRDNRHQLTLRMAGEPFEADIESGIGMMIPVSGQIRGQSIRGVIGAYSGHGFQGFLVIGTTKPEDWAAWEPRMKSMFESISFVKVDKNAMVTKWRNSLMGKKLEHKSSNVTGQAQPALAQPAMAQPVVPQPGMVQPVMPPPIVQPGMVQPGLIQPGMVPFGMAPPPPGMAQPGTFFGGAQQQDYHLCSDGTMISKSAAVGQVAAPNMTVYGRGMNQERGNWDVDVTMGEPFLLLRDGPVQGFRLEVDGDNLMLDGKPYIVTVSDQCK